MEQVPLINAAIRGVDGYSNPLTLNGMVRHAVNLRFDRGVVSSRPGFCYTDTGVTGVFRGVEKFSPSKGLSFRQFAGCAEFFALAVDEKVFLVPANNDGIQKPALNITPGPTPDPCRKTADILAPVWMFQAENYLIIQNPRSDTAFWDGEKTTISPGMFSEFEQTNDHSSNTLVTEKHKNWLVNAAGLGVYWNGRVHQQTNTAIYVGDIIHKRRTLSTVDVLLMEEQSLISNGPPLFTNSKMGALVALEGSAQMGTANGEGLLVGYYENGIVTYNTFLSPRETRYDAEGKKISSGWSDKQMVSHLCGVISAVGRYSVAKLPRDQFFRSMFGIHILSQVAGVETINDESEHSISHNVSNVLDEDNPEFLSGTSCGYWIRGSRWVTTVGLRYDPDISVTPFGTAFVVWDKAWSKTADNTPLPAWDGVWATDNVAIHRFITAGGPALGKFGFIGTKGESIVFAEFDNTLKKDVHGGEEKQIPWCIETKRVHAGNRKHFTKIGDCDVSAKFQCSGLVKIFFRTNFASWKLASSFRVDLDKLTSVNHNFRIPDNQQAEWFEFRVEGPGYVSELSFSVEISEGDSYAASGRQETYNHGKLKAPLVSPSL